MLEKLQDIGMKEFYLWGRSMGAATIVNFMNKFRNTGLDVMGKIKYLVIDSTYVSLKSVVKEFANSLYNIPQFLASPFIGAVFRKI